MTKIPCKSKWFCRNFISKLEFDLKTSLPIRIVIVDHENAGIESIAKKFHKMIQESQTKCIQFEYEALRQEQVHAKTYLRQDKLRQICTNEQKTKAKSRTTAKAATTE